jgi:hypothetical protein
MPFKTRSAAFTLNWIAAWRWLYKEAETCRWFNYILITFYITEVVLDWTVGLKTCIHFIRATAACLRLRVGFSNPWARGWTSITLYIIWYYTIWYMIWYDIHMLTAIGMTSDCSSTVHIYTQTIHRTTQLTILVGRLSGVRTQSGQTKINDELTA